MGILAEQLRNKAHKLGSKPGVSAVKEEVKQNAPPSKYMAKKTADKNHKNPVGRPRTKVIPEKNPSSVPEDGVLDLEKVKRLAFIHCTEQEIASVLNVPYTWLSAQPVFHETYTHYKDKGKQSLRRWMWKNAEKGNVGMQVWLSKNQLGFHDPDFRITGKDGGPIKTELNIGVVSPLAKELTEKIIAGEGTGDKVTGGGAGSHVENGNG